MNTISESIHVLHVDDEPDFAELSETFLERENERLTVTTAASAAEGLDLLADYEIDCVVSDYDMPGQDGIEFLERVREDHLDLPFILFTGKGSEEVASDAISAGVTDYLQKEPGNDQYAVLANRIANLAEKYRAEMAQKRHRVLVEEATDAILIVDPDATIRYATPSAESVLGRTPEELVGTSGFEPIHPDQKDRVIEEFRELAQEPGGRRTVEFRYRRPDDSWIWVQVRGRNLLETDVVNGIVIYTTDITERKEREQRFRRYEQMVNTMQEAACIYDADGRYVVVNEYLADFYNTTPTALEGESSNLIPQIRANAEGDPYQELLNGERDEIRGEVDGSFPGHGDEVLAFRLTPLVVDGTIEGVVGVAHEITKRKERETQLQETNTILRTVLENFPAGVLVEDTDRNILMANERFTDVLDAPVTPEELLDQDCSEIAEEIKGRFADPDGFIAGIEKTITRREPESGTELPLDDGRILEREYIPYSLPDGEANLWIYHDVTERKQRQRAIDNLHEIARELMQAGTPEEVGEITVEAMRDVLDMPANVIHLYDADENGLTPVAWTEAGKELVGEIPTFYPGDGLAWDVFETGVAEMHDDVSTAEGRLNPDTDIRSEIILPLGDHGVLLIGSDMPGVFDEADISLAQTLTAHATTVLDRLEDEHKLRQATEQHRTLVENFPDGGVFLYDTDLRCVLGGGQGLAAADLTLSDIEGKRPQDRYPADIANELETHLMAAFDGKTKEFEQTYKGRTYRIQTLPIGDEPISHVMAVSQDVTDRIKREHELERYEAIVENANDGIYVFDAEGRFEFVNQRFVDVTGKPREVWIGEHVSRLADHGVLTEANVAKIESGIETVLNSDTEKVSVELTPDVSPDMEVIELRLTPFQSDEGTKRVIGFSRDITDRKQREQTLEKLQKRTHSLMNTPTKEETAQIAVDAAHEVLGAPLSGVHLLSEDGETLEPVAFVDTVRKELGTAPTYDRTDEDSSAQVVWETFERGEPLVIEDTRNYGSLSEVTPARTGIIHPLDDHGVFIVSATEANEFDVVDRTLLDILATTLLAGLDRAEREEKLRRQNDRLDQFTRIVSHDLRNPLNVASGRLELAQAECDSDHLDDVARAHERMVRLIDDLLTLAREDESITEIGPVSLATVVEACWHNVDTGDATLEIEADHSIQADRSRLQQLLENLVGNAVEHGHTDVTITVGELVDGFYVEDDGPGIPAEEREQVFEAGYSTVANGTGFGLSIVEEIATAHGWDISVTESDAGGARFEITGVDYPDATQ